jgi:hypothetical protein
MKRGAPSDRFEDVAHALVVLDQQRAGGRAHEHLHPRTSRQALELGQVLGVLARAADEKREIAMHAVTRALDLVGQRVGADGQRVGVRHLEHRRDAAHDRAQGARFQVLLVGHAGLSEMHLGVDHAGQHVQAAGVDHLGGRVLGQIPDSGDAAAP